MSLTAETRESLRRVLRESAGIQRDEGRDYLAEARLTALAQELGFDGLPALIARAGSHGALRVRQRVVDAMTTNETSFFRGPSVFRAIERDILPALLARRQRRKSLVVVSAASSSGQEAYSLAMIADQLSQLDEGWRLGIHGWDISRESIERARQGLYTQLEVNRGLPARNLVRYFQRDPEGWRLRPQIREMVSFREANLARAWPTTGPIDVLLLRHVLIYLDDDTRRDIANQMARRLAPDGYVLLGAGESIAGLHDMLEEERVGTVVYTRRADRPQDGKSW